MSTITMPAGQELPSFALSGQERNGVCPDDKWYEIVNGERVELPPMSIFAVAVNGCLHLHLGSFVAAKKLGRVVLEAKFILDTAKKFQRQPDLAFVSSQTWPLNKPLPRTGDWQVVPDLAVEVVSPNDLFEDVLAKIIEYFSFGVKCSGLFRPFPPKYSSSNRRTRLPC